MDANSDGSVMIVPRTSGDVTPESCSSSTDGAAQRRSKFKNRQSKEVDMVEEFLASLNKKNTEAAVVSEIDEENYFLAIKPKRNHDRALPKLKTRSNSRSRSRKQSKKSRSRRDENESRHRRRARSRRRSHSRRSKSKDRTRKSCSSWYDDHWNRRHDPEVRLKSRAEQDVPKSSQVEQNIPKSGQVEQNVPKSSQVRLESRRSEAETPAPVRWDLRDVIETRKAYHESSEILAERRKWDRLRMKMRQLKLRSLSLNGQYSAELEDDSFSVSVPAEKPDDCLIVPDVFPIVDLADKESSEEEDGPHRDEGSVTRPVFAIKVESESEDEALPPQDVSCSVEKEVPTQDASCPVENEVCSNANSQDENSVDQPLLATLPDENARPNQNLSLAKEVEVEVNSDANLNKDEDSVNKSPLAGAPDDDVRPDCNESPVEDGELRFVELSYDELSDDSRLSVSSNEQLWRELELPLKKDENVTSEPRSWLRSSDSNYQIQNGPHHKLPGEEDVFSKQLQVDHENRDVENERCWRSETPEQYSSSKNKSKQRKTKKKKRRSSSSPHPVKVKRRNAVEEKSKSPIRKNCGGSSVDKPADSSAVEFQNLISLLEERKRLLLEKSELDKRQLADKLSSNNGSHEETDLPAEIQRNTQNKEEDDDCVFVDNAHCEGPHEQEEDDDCVFVGNARGEGPLIVVEDDITIDTMPVEISTSRSCTCSTRNISKVEARLRSESKRLESESQTVSALFMVKALKSKVKEIDELLLGPHICDDLLDINDYFQIVADCKCNAKKINVKSYCSCVEEQLRILERRLQLLIEICDSEHHKDWLQIMIKTVESKLEHCNFLKEAVESCINYEKKKACCKRARTKLQRSFQIEMEKIDRLLQSNLFNVKQKETLLADKQNLRNQITLNYKCGSCLKKGADKTEVPTAGNIDEKRATQGETNDARMMHVEESNCNRTISPSVVRPGSDETNRQPSSSKTFAMSNKGQCVPLEEVCSLLLQSLDTTSEKTTLSDQGKNSK